MILIFGGAYNGKINFVKEQYKTKQNELFFCKSDTLDLSCKVIVGLHVFIKECILKDLNPLDIIKENISILQDKIIICDEICSGIVPLEKEDRIWREECGRTLQYLSKKSNKVYRIFFGIGEVLKDE